MKTPAQIQILSSDHDLLKTPTFTYLLLSCSNALGRMRKISISRVLTFGEVSLRSERIQGAKEPYRERGGETVQNPPTVGVGS